MGMDEENEFASLPDNSEEAFAVLHRRRTKELDEAYEENRAAYGWSVHMSLHDQFR